MSTDCISCGRRTLGWGPEKDLCYGCWREIEPLIGTLRAAPATAEPTDD